MIINESVMNNLAITLKSFKSYLHGAGLSLGTNYKEDPVEFIISGPGGKIKYKKVIDGFNKKFDENVQFTVKPDGTYVADLSKC